MRTFLLPLLASATAVVGHSTFQDLWVGDVDHAESCARIPPNNNPVTSVSSEDIRCNVGGATGISGTCEAAGGSSMTVEMHAQPGDRACETPAIGGNHFGPVMVYMSKVDDATSADGSSSWFKVSEEGYNGGVWGTDSLNSNCGKHVFTVPDLAPGDYLVRAEAIALHTAGQEGGAQFYMTCYQVKITGSGSLNPEGVSFPGAYSATDPGILIDIYSPIDNYIIPGPPVVS
ncbi:hypothetical protein FQN55_003751 [Onygenales sp. PD_40]|nr:hypothetical protein FQN55_003751 [Onygenales sp. PD_40]KAK2770180.1 hypothetical protein FQN53_005690 [Emmonsiellopsis sp. PD_33]KAK2793982.1 hypothetical protein FQN52_000314 [Onygenales sp. PD_12]KAK2800617.1 hypothetical protein FQN51_006000 [Onygenales sp. PD_10]